MKNNNNIWIGEQDLLQKEDFYKDIDREKSLLAVESAADAVENLGGNRRDFLKMLGFGLSAATIAAGCDTPVKRAIPYVIKPEEIVPGVATYYASSYVDGGDYCSILVKTREGRPIKIEGNAMSPISKGGTSARVQASVLSLYDTNRFRNPMVSVGGTGFADSDWNEVDDYVSQNINAGSKIKVVTNSIISPLTNASIDAFKAKYPNTEVVSYDSVSYSGALSANEQNFGQRVMPGYKFDKADVIVSFGADFLGTWLSPTEFARDYASKRAIKDVNNPAMSRHIQVESHMSMTGSNADNRILVKPSEQGVAIAHLYNTIAGGSASTSGLNNKAKSALSKAASQLQAAAGKSIVVSNSNNVAEQLMVNAINNALGNYGATLDMSSANLLRTGSDEGFAKMCAEMNAGSVDAVIINNCNPSYDGPNTVAFNSGLAKVKNKIALSYAPNETNIQCDVIAPVNHYLESWGDAMPVKGHVSLIQPTISPLFTTRQSEESFMKWSGSDSFDMNAEQPVFEALKNSWRSSIFANQSKYASFDSFWTNALHDGMADTNSGEPLSFSDAGINSSAITKVASSELEISFFETVNMGNGQYAGNPWLMEMPDPVARTSWGNYLAVPVNFDGVRTMVGLNDLKDGDLVKLTIGDKEMLLPVIQQFGQMAGTVGLALGYGRTEAGECGTGVGINVNDFISSNENRNYFNSNVSVSTKVGKEDAFSCVQYHHTYGVKGVDAASGEVVNADEQALAFFDYFTGVKGYQGALTDRSVVYTSNVNDLKDNIADLKHKREEAQYLNSKQIYSGYDEQYAMGHHWGMHVDLNACIGCGACTVACMAENNVPVVGKKEVSRHHEMTWLRIDRYFYGDIESPNTVYHPMMCQHCDNAPCENVCPVNATNHSSEGLNQMTYNRCVGTRYCANNCPYKVRRFNWLDYTTADIFPGNQPKINGEDIPFGADDLTRMVLNPDVTVRARGVIEKCSFCVQRLQEGKLSAKKEGRKLMDSDVKVACQTACPTGAITFGDMNNKGDVLDQKIKSDLTYIALEEINVRSSVNYTMKVNNKDESLIA